MAQWKNVAPNLLLPFTAGFGAIYYAHGTLWAGQQSLWSSADSGRTWQKSSFPEDMTIRDIQFLDKFNGLVATVEGLFLTRDGGQSWKQILSAECWETSFNGSPLVLHALTTAPGVFFSSLDGGVTWTTSYLGAYGMSFGIARNHTVHVFSGERYLNSSRGWVNSSTDYGMTWTNNGASIDGDSYTLSVDSCDPNRLYLVNEDFASSNDEESEFFLSTDAGLSWLQTLSDSGRLLSGALGTTKNTIYASTVTNFRFYRSTDRGMTWTISNGPAIGYDTRGVMAADDNTVFALSFNGSVWATFNSGGDSIASVDADDILTAVIAKHSEPAVVRAADTVEVPVYVKFPVGSQINTITPDEVTMVIKFDSAMLSLSGADLWQHVIPPAGWSFKEGKVSEGTAIVTLANTSGTLLNFDQDLGSVIFNVLASPSTRTSVVALEKIAIASLCRTYVASLHIETGYLRLIRLGTESVASETGLSSISVYPNPATQTISVVSASPLGNVRLVLSDQLGKNRIIHTLDLWEEPATIDVSALPSGMYYVHIYGAGQMMVRTFIINR